MIVPLILTVAASAASPVIPLSFRGTWQEARYGCNSGMLHTRLIVEAGSVSDGEFEADVLKLRQDSNRQIVFDAIWDAEDAERVSYRWKLDAKKRVLTSEVIASDATHDGGTSATRYVRCGVHP